MVHRGMAARGEPGCLVLTLVMLGLAILGGVVAALVTHHGRMPVSMPPPASSSRPAAPSSSASSSAPAASPSLSRAPAAVVMYTVRRGDTLYAIAMREYGMPDRWTVIYAANRKRLGPMPDLIYPGERLVIPALH